MKNTSLGQKSITGLAAAILGFSFSLMPMTSAYATDNWKASFEEVCSKVDASQSLSPKELSDLIVRADKLMPEIQNSDDPSKKVYLRRLKNCRSMFEFMIESQKGK